MIASDPTAQAGVSAKWYAEPKGDAHTTLVPVFRMVREESEWRVDADEYHAGLYCSSDKPGIRGRSQRGCEYGPATMPYNVTRQAVDTLTAKIGQHRNLPEVLTNRGSWKDQKRAKKQTQFIEGEFYRQRIFEKHAKTILRDAQIFGRGALKVWTEGRRIKTERTFPWELYADEWDARYGSPRNLYHCRSVDKGVLLEQYARTESGGWKGKVRDAIDGAGRFDLHYDMVNSGSGCTVDRVDIIEAWHLCDRPEEHEQAEDLDREPEEEGARDEEEQPTEAPVDQGDQPRKHKCTGRHVVVTTAGTLIDEPWEYDYFPYVVLSYNDALVGTWGHGLVEQLEGYQYEINMATERLSEMYRLSGVMVATPDGAKVHDSQFVNGIHVMRHANGGVPQVLQLDLVNEHVRQRPRELTQDALNESGMSQMSVQSQKPAGITAGIALQTLDDIETERFMIFGRAYEDWCLELGRRFLDCAKQIAAAYGDYAVSVPMKGGLVKLRWSDVWIDGVELRMESTSLLSKQIGGKLDKLMMLWESGKITDFTFYRLLDDPDLQAELDLETADKLVVDEILQRMLDAEEEEGEAAYFAPSAYQDYAWAAKRAQQRYNRGFLDGAPEFNLELLQRYMKQCQQEMEKLAPPAAPGAPQVPAGSNAQAAPLAPAPQATPLPPIPGLMQAA